MWIVRSRAWGQPIPVYGDGQNGRDWLYVEDHCPALERILSQGEPGSTYCIGGRSEVANIDLVTMLCALMDELAPRHGVHLPVSPSCELITYVSDRPGHDRRYAIDVGKSEAELGWTPQVSVQEGLRRMVSSTSPTRVGGSPYLSEERTESDHSPGDSRAGVELFV